MSLAGYLLDRLAFGTSSFGLGFALVGTLPTDVSSPLLVYIARGNVALATVLNAINTALAPILAPALFLLYTGVELDVPVAALMGELAVTVIVPTVVGVAIRTRWTPRIEPAEPVLPATASLAYLPLVIAVVGPNAEAILDQPAMIAAAAGVALALTAFGYLLVHQTATDRPRRPDRDAVHHLQEGVQHRGLRRVRLRSPARCRPARGRVRRRSDDHLTPGRQNRRPTHDHCGPRRNTDENSS